MIRSDAGRAGPEADHGKRRGSEALEIGVLVHPGGEVLSQKDVAAQAVAQAFLAEVAQHEPELQRAEAPPKLHAVIHEIARVGVFRRPQVFGHQAEGGAQRFGMPAIEGAEVEGREQPFVGVHHQRVGALAAGQNVAEFGQHGGGPGIGGIDVQPHLLGGADLGDGRNRVHAGGGRGPHRGHRAERQPAAGPVLPHGGGQRRRIHAELAVGGDLAHALLADAQHDGRFFDGRMSLFGGVKAEARPAGHALFPQPQVQRLAGRGDGAQAADRGRVHHHAEELLRQAQHFSQPAHHHFFQLGGRRPRAPQHGVHVEGLAEHLAQNAGPRAGDGKVGEEAGMVPVRDAGKDQPLPVVEHAIEIFAGFRGGVRKRGLQLPGLNPRQHRQALGVSQVIGDPIHQAVSVPPEFFGRHVASGMAFRLCKAARSSHYSVPFAFHLSAA